MNANADNTAVARNALAGYGAWAVNLGIGLVVTPILLHHLGADGFGAWTLALAVASYVGLVELGLGVATVRHLASSLAIGDTERASIVAASSRATYMVMAGLGALVLAALLIIPGSLVRTAGIPSDRVRVTILVLGLGYLFSLAASVYPAVAAGAGRVDLGVTTSVLLRAVTAVGQVAAVLIFGTVIALGIATAIGTLAGALAVRHVARRRFKAVDVRLGNARRDVVRMLLASGWRNYGIGVGAAMAIQSDVIVVGAILGSIAVASYGIAVRASSVFVDVASRATDVLYPTFAHTTALQETHRTVTAFRESVFLARAMLLPALVTMVAFGNPLLRLWLGTVPANANTVLILLLVGAVVAAPGRSALVLLTGMNRLNYMLVGVLVTAIANLGLSVLLTWEFGIIGPVLGSIAAFLVWDMLLLPRHVGSILRIPWLPLSTAGFAALAAPTLAASAAATVIVDGLGWTTPREGFVGAIIVGVVYVAVLWVTLEAERRARYQRLVRSAVRRRAT